MNFSLLILLQQATAGAHCREEPLSSSLSRREAAKKSFGLSTGQLSEEFRWDLVIVQNRAHGVVL